VASNVTVRRFRDEDAETTARLFFERQGWSVVRRQTVWRGGIALTNFAMEKVLP